MKRERKGGNAKKRKASEEKNEHLSQRQWPMGPYLRALYGISNSITSLVRQNSLFLSGVLGSLAKW